MPHDRPRALVLGAGISGLAAARTLQDRGVIPQVLEACPSVGGLTRSVRVGEFCFDYTGHLLHLARYGTPEGIPFAGQRDSDWQRIDRKSFCLVGGRLVTAPIQYHLGQLADDDLASCLQAYETRPPLPTSGPVTFRDFVISGFGQHLADLFLIPQNEKTMATSLERLSTAAVKRFFPPPDDARVRAGLRNGTESPGEYNSQFWYPKVGGIERLVDGLADSVARLALLQEICEVDLRAHRIRTRSGQEWTWDVAFSSIPLRVLCERSLDSDLRAWARSLTHSSTISFNFGFREPLSPAVEGVHWVYVPDRSLPFYRVGFYSNISAGTCPPGCTSAYVEVGLPSEDLRRVDIARDLQPKVLAGLASLGWVDVRSMACSVTHVMSCAYVHHTPERERVVADVFRRLAESDVHPIGRYGLWDYTSMEDSVSSGMETVERVMG